MEAPPTGTYWIVPERILAGPYPGSPWPHQRPPLLIALLERGFSFFLDLTELYENDTHPYKEDLADLAVAAGRPAIHRRIAVPDFGTPSTAQMHEILAMIDAAFEEGHRIYVHCFAGVGRTATVSGCYLVHHGCNVRRALKILNPESRGIFSRSLRRPGAPEQRRMVETWAAAEQEKRG